MRIERSWHSRYAGIVRSIQCLSSLALATLFVASGCLGQSHVIPKHELQTLAQADPQSRGQRVRVVQSFAGRDEPPPAPGVDRYGNPRPVVVIGHTHTHHHHNHTPGKPVSTASAKSSKKDAKAWLVLAAAVAVGAALTEGMRYDGWIEMHPMHPVHLYGWDGRYQWMPLSQITPEVAAWTRKAVIRRSEGPWKQLGRAPLNRRGWTYSLLMGSSEVSVPDQEQELRGFASHIQLGRFVNKQVGVLLDFGFTWADDDVGETLFESRNSLELQYMPVAASVLHAGLFGQIGMGYRLDDRWTGSDRRGFLLGGGAMAQLELTTRLALTARAAQTWAFGTRTSDFTVGISIY